MHELYPRGVRRVLLVLAVLALALPASAGAAHFRVVVDPNLTTADLPELAHLGAVGLLVPANGPTTSRHQARVALARGETESAYLGGIPEGKPLIRVRRAAKRSTPTDSGPRAATILLGIPGDGPRANDRRYPIVVVGGGFDGVLTSDATRISGLVSIADVAPTAIGRADGLGWESHSDAAAYLTSLDDRIAAKNDVRLATVLLALMALIVVAAVAPRLAPAVFPAGLVGNLAAGISGSSVHAVLVAIVAGVTVGGVVAIARWARDPTVLGFVFTGVIAAYLIAMAIDPKLIAFSPWGAPQNGRFYGISNELETMLLVPALGGAALLYRRFGLPGFAAVALLSFVTVAGNRFGADGGGAVVLAVGFAALGVGLVGGSRRAAAVAVAGAIALAAALVGIDALTGGSSHVTRALHGGPGELAGDLGRRLHLSWERATSSWAAGLTTFGCLAALVVLVVLFLRRRPTAAERAVPLAFLAALAASLVVNDSPNDVAAVGLAGFAALVLGRLAPDESAGPARSAPGRRPLARDGWLRRRGERRAHA